MPRHKSGRLLVVGAMLWLAACSPSTQIRGYVPDEDVLGQLRPGVHDRASVSDLLGSPSSLATFEDRTWYYITRRTEQRAFFNETAREQLVVALEFDDGGILQDVRRYTLADGKLIEPVDRKTPTRGKELTVFEQFFGNLGRFSSREQR